MAVKAFNKEKDSFVKIASLQSNDIVVDKIDFVSNNVGDALSELKRDVKSMQSNIAWIYNNGTIGGGSGTGSGYTGIIQVENFDKNHNLVLGDADAAEVKFKIASKLNSAFTVKLTIGTTVKNVTVMPNVTSTVNFGQLSQGTFEIKIEANDYTGFPTETWMGHVIKGLISIESSFTGEKQYAANDVVAIPYAIKVSTAIKQNVTLQYVLDNDEPVIINNHPSDGNTRYLYINEKQNIMSMGFHKVVVTATVSTDGVNTYSVTRTFQFEVYDLKHILVYVPNTTKNIYTLNQTATIPFNIVAAPENIELGFDVTWKLFKGENTIGSHIKTGTIELTTGSNGQVVIFLDEHEGFAAGELYTLSLSAKVKYSTVETTEDCNFTFSVRTISGMVSPWGIVEDSLILYCKALGKQSLATLDNQIIWENEATKNQLYNPGDCIVVNPVAAPFIIPDENNKSAEETNFLCLWGQSYAYIDFDIAGIWNGNTGLKNSGCSIDFVYRCKSNGNKDAVVASYGYYKQEGDSIKLNEGFEITANEIKFEFAKGKVSNTYVMEDEWIHCTIVFEPDTITYNKTYLKVYLNGVLSGCAIADKNIATNQDAISYFGKLCFGARHYIETVDSVPTEMINDYSDLDIRNIKLYSKALTAQEVVINYIDDEYYMHSDENGDYDGQHNSNLRALNGFDNDKNYNINNIVIPKIFIKPKSKQIADDFRKASELTQSDATISEYACYIQYVGIGEGNSNVNFDIHSWNTNPNNTSIIDSTIKVQGTTSLQYNHKNYDICFGKWSDNNTDVLFTPRFGSSNVSSGKDWLPENIFTLKADLIDSSHANNVGTATAIAAICDNQQLNVQIPPMADPTNENSKSVKYAIEGFPCALYIYDDADNSYVNENQPGNASFYGVYMFDLGRNTVNNFGMQNLKINSWASSNGAPCVVDSYELIKGNAEEMYALENTFIFEGSANAADNSSIDFVNTNLQQITVDWEMRYPIIKSDVSAVKESAYDMLRTAVVKASNYITDRDGFMDGTWNKSACMLYLLCAYVFGMADNLGKNMQLRTWDAKEWFPMFYDMDTVLGLNNSGSLYYNTNVDLDEYGEGQRHMQIFGNSPIGEMTYSKSYGSENQPGRGKGIYNTPNSRLWNAVRSEQIWFGTWNENKFTDDSFRETYRTLRSTVLTYDNLWNYYNSIVGSIGQMMYNEDALIKYLDSNISTNVDPSTYSFENLDRLHGTRELLTKRWLRDRLYYLDSLFDIKTSGEATKTKIKNIRSYLTGNPLNITVKTKCPVFVTSEQGDKGWQDTKLCGPDYFAHYDFYTTTGNEIVHNFDNATLISYVRGLYNGLSTLQMDEAKNLLEIAFPGTTYLQSITTAGMRSLRTVNLRDCVNLNSVLDLTQAKFLTTLDISNTKMPNILLPTGGTLQTFNAENTQLASLDLTAQTQLEILNLSGSTGLTSITIAKCDSLREITITQSKLASLVISDCPNLERVILSDNGSLIDLKFVNCKNVKVLDLSNCTNKSFAPFTHVTEGDINNMVDLRQCINIEELILTNCSAKVILLPEEANALKKLYCENSQLMQTVYLTANSRDYADAQFVRNGQTLHLPAVDFSRFQNLEYVTFKNNKYVQAVTGFNYSGNADAMFYGCTELYGVKGHIIFKENTSQTFSNLSNRFRLTETHAEGKQTLAFTIESTVTSLTSLFNLNSGIVLNDVYYFCSKFTPSLKSIAGLFSWCSLQRNESGSTTESLNATVFSKATGLTDISNVFRGAGLKNTFPSNILSPCADLVNVSSAFEQNDFSVLDSDFSSKIFENKSKLTNVSRFLCNNKSLKTSTTQPVKLDELFKSASKVTNCSYFLGITETYDSGVYVADDMYIDNSPRRELYISFTNSTSQDRLFANTPNMTTCRGAFSKCKFSAGVSISNNIFGGAKDMQGNNYIGDDGKTAAFPINMKDVAYCFHDCGAQIVLDDKIFSRLKNLEDASAFVSGGYSNRSTLINGTVSQCPAVTADSTVFEIFRNNTGLLRANRFFESTGVTFNLRQSESDKTHPLFISNSQLQEADFLFRGSKITGGVPALLFGNCPSIKTVRGLFANTAIGGDLPGSVSRPGEYLFKNISTNSQDNKYLELIDVSQMFRNCVGLGGDIPADMFEYTPSVRNVSHYFNGCGEKGKLSNGIQSTIPQLLFAPMTQLTDASYFFARCYGLKSYGDLTDYFVPEGLFENNVSITTLEGLFEEVPVTKVAAGVFQNLRKLTNVSRMFCNSNRSKLDLPESSFQTCNFINNIELFMGNIMGYDSGGGLSNNTMRQFFKYKGTGEFGQYNITNVNRAFASNPNATGNIIDFWNWEVKPTNTADCYEGCTALISAYEIPNEYK